MEAGYWILLRSNWTWQDARWWHGGSHVTPFSTKSLNRIMECKPEITACQRRQYGHVNHFPEAENGELLIPPRYVGKIIRWTTYLVWWLGWIGWIVKHPPNSTPGDQDHSLPLSLFKMVVSWKLKRGKKRVEEVTDSTKLGLCYKTNSLSFTRTLR